MSWPSRMPIISFGVVVILILVALVLHNSTLKRSLPVPAGAASIPPELPKDAPIQSESSQASIEPPLAATRSHHSLSISNQALADFLNRDGDAPRVTPDQSARLTSVSDPAEMAAVVDLLMDVTEGDTERNEAINLLRRSHYANLSERLLDLLNSEDEAERMRCFATQHLGMSLGEEHADRRYTIIQRLHDALQDRHLGVRREALSSLVRVGDSLAIKLVSHGLDSPEWEFARDLLIYALLETDHRNAIVKIRELAVDPDEIVRVAAIYVLGQWKDELSRPMFERASSSPSYRIRQASDTALLNLSLSKAEITLMP